MNARDTQLLEAMLAPRDTEARAALRAADAVGDLAEPNEVRRQGSHTITYDDGSRLSIEYVADAKQRFREFEFDLCARSADDSSICYGWLNA